MSAALVTGAGARLGARLALALGRAGLDVAVHCGRSRDGAEGVADRVRAMGRRAAVLQADLMDEDAAAALVGRAARGLGPVTVLVNSAAVFGNDRMPATTRDAWEAAMAVNLRAPYLLTQAMAAAHGGGDALVVNMLDTKLRKMTPNHAAYTVAKAGLWAVTRIAAQEYGHLGLRVNAIAPGSVVQGTRQSDAHWDAQRDTTPLGRGAEVEDVCATLTWLVGARAVTGQMIHVDAGQHLNWQTPDEMP
ncbi:MAG: SDR family oxidoreductase [Paracoccaceae bacterium]